MKEDNPFEACQFIKLVATSNVSEDVRNIAWNTEYARLSAKWILLKYVTYFAGMIQNDLKRFSSVKTSPLLVSGFAAGGYLGGDGIYLLSESSHSNIYENASNPKIKILPYFDEDGQHYLKVRLLTIY